jgi:hypothetical protein
MVNLPESHPYNDAHLNAMNNVLQAIAHANGIVEKLSNVGLDVSEPRDKLAMQHKIISGLKSQFFPNHP